MTAPLAAQLKGLLSSPTNHRIPSISSVQAWPTQWGLLAASSSSVAANGYRVAVTSRSPWPQSDVGAGLHILSDPCPVPSMLQRALGTPSVVVYNGSTPATPVMLLTQVSRSNSTT
ncbi:hypothetical protein JDV02_003898 [Purpureocillium takamizusanense]|uniref:Uncharacterized protein n=1 Tax=Purpureocillium takamizusanense TaxID=2060973 RepID=A0A9Q8V9B7_9HYPO|nr:uncharacterized protein JDV02_003898 [Purpureocillium takamizusanense]UNI17568.1 hypothetical protein JDV02_003898 [Purpureocillium takamizusanense]